MRENEVLRICSSKKHLTLSHTGLMGLIAGIFTILILLCITDNANAQAPIWQDNLDCPDDFQHYDGLEYCRIIDETTGDVIAYVIVVDLQNSGVGFEYVIAWGVDENGVEGFCRDVNIPAVSTGVGCRTRQDENKYPIMSLLNAVSYAGSPALVIDSDYGAKSGSQGHGPEGFTIITGNRIDGPDVNDFDLWGSTDPNTNNAVQRPWLALSAAAPYQSLMSQIPEDGDDGDEYLDWIELAVGGGPWIIQDGQVVGPWMVIDGNSIENVQELCNLYYPTSCYNDADQVSVGLSQDGRWLYLLLVKADTANLDITTDILVNRLNAYQAMKFDGGGSAQLWYGGIEGDALPDKIVEDGNGRWLSQYLAINAQPGTGINLDIPLPTPPPEPDDDQNLWEKIANWFSQTWENLWQGLTDWFEEQKENLVQRIEDWLEEQERKLLEALGEQLAQWCNSMCGMALLPGGAAAAVWYVRRRRSG